MPRRKPDAKELCVGLRAVYYIAMRNRLHNRQVVACLVLACVVGATGTAGAQDQSPAGQQNQDSVVVNADEVLFDVVVRDKKGRLVRDLTVSDFEVYEDGVRQEINSFRLVAPPGAPTSTAGGATRTDRGDSRRLASSAGLTNDTPDRAGASGV